MRAFLSKVVHKAPALYRVLRPIWLILEDAWVGLKHIFGHGAYANRKYFVMEEKKLIYVSNSKVASSSIKASMMAQPDVDDYSLVCLAVRRSGRYLSNIPRNAYPDCYRFTFVRNPFDRLVSCYENKYHSDVEKTGGSARPYEEGMYYDRYLFGYLRKDKGFHHFAKKVCGIPDWLADRHFVGQDYLMTDQGRSVTDFIGRMEDLPEAFDPICEKYQLQPLPHYNQTGKPKADRRDKYDLKTAQMVYERYARDIVAFGYKKEADALIAYLKAKEAGEAGERPPAAQGRCP